MKKYAIILAGGEGRRAGGNIPKQMRVIDGMPMVWWSMHAFVEYDPDTVLIAVVHPGLMDDWRLMWDELPSEKRLSHILCCGGRNRTESVKNGLAMIPVTEESLVAVHDAARPLLTKAIISRGWNTANLFDAGVPVIKVTDSIRKIEGEDSYPVNREELRAVQTPQVFKNTILQKAYRGINPTEVFTDDASLVQNTGFEVAMFEGDPENMKVTHPIDFDIAELLLKSRRQ